LIYYLYLYKSYKGMKDGTLIGEPVDENSDDDDDEEYMPPVGLPDMPHI
jgi:hypothetical protein